MVLGNMHAREIAVGTLTCGNATEPPCPVEFSPKPYTAWLFSQDIAKRCLSTNSECGMKGDDTAASNYVWTLPSWQYGQALIGGANWVRIEQKEWRNRARNQHASRMYIIYNKWTQQNRLSVSEDLLSVLCDDGASMSDQQVLLCNRSRYQIS